MFWDGPNTFWEGPRNGLRWYQNVFGDGPNSFGMHPKLWGWSQNVWGRSNFFGMVPNILECLSSPSSKKLRSLSSPDVRIADHPRFLYYRHVARRPMMVPFQANKSPPLGPAEQLHGGSAVRSFTSLLILLSAMNAELAIRTTLPRAKSTVSFLRNIFLSSISTSGDHN